MRGQAGFTILEVIIVAVILTMVLLAGTDVLGTTGATFGTGISITSLEAKANRLLDRIVAELRQAGVATLDPAVPAGSPAITYRRGAGYENGVALWGPSRRIELRPDEVQDGADNDSDGVVDEHDIVWIADPGLPTERTVLWAHGIRPRLEGEEPNGADDNGNGLVDEPGLCFRLRDETLIVELTVEGRDPKGRLFVRTATSAVRLRN